MESFFNSYKTEEVHQIYDTHEQGGPKLALKQSVFWLTSGFDTQRLQRKAVN